MSSAIVTTAWLFVGLRVAHSLVHLTTNNVVHRLYVFVASNTALLVLWGMGAWAIWLKSAL